MLNLVENIWQFMRAIPPPRCGALAARHHRRGTAGSEQSVPAQFAAWHFAGVGTGITISALLIEALHSLHLDWRAMWLGGGAISLAAVAAVAALVPDVAERKTATERAASAAPSPQLWRLIAAYGLFGFGYVITATSIGDPHGRTVLPWRRAA
jgi:hypothetical protein